MTQTQVSGSGIKNNVITNNHLHSAANIASSKLANSGVTAGSYGSGSATLSLTINAKGVITAASTNAISIGTSNISNNSVTFEKIENIVANQIIGRITSGTGSPQALSAAHVRTIINVEDGATADQTASEILTLIKTVDGAGSGLNADTLDGISSASFLRSDADDSTSGNLTITSNGNYPFNINGIQNPKIVLQGSSDPYIRFREGTTDKAYIQWSSSGFLQLANQETGEYLNIAGGSNGLTFTVDGSEKTVWHSGNDGSGSGLDADNFDGQASDTFLRHQSDVTTHDWNTFIDGTEAGWRTVLNASGSNRPTSAYSYGTVLSFSKSTQAKFQLYIPERASSSGSSAANSLWFRSGWGTTYRDWLRIIDTNDTGAGNGLDADKLDGQEGAHYLDASNFNAGTLPSTRIGSATVPSPTSSISIMGNFGQWQTHGTYQDFNADVAYWGWNFMNNNTNAPTTASSQWYRSRLALGSGYGIGTASNNYWLEMAIPRYNHSTSGQMYIRSCENGSIGSWTEVGSRPRNHVIPYDNNTIDLGSTTVRWRNVYTNDLNLSNEGGSNDVDMTWGSFTIQEGHHDLFLINKRTGKKYKFNLTEVK